MAFMFENLDVYRKAVDFADEITSVTAEFPRGFYFLADQLNRAALSDRLRHSGREASSNTPRRFAARKASRVRWLIQAVIHRPDPTQVAHPAGHC